MDNSSGKKTRNIFAVTDCKKELLKAMDGFIALPEWTHVPQKNGLDPLGMQAAGVRLYQNLVPGISNVTLRIRYYGLYAWLNRTYAEQIHAVDYEEWRKRVRRAEALYALVAAKAVQAGSIERGVAGIDWANRRLSNRGRSNVIEFSGDTDPDGEGTPYLKQSWGAYGAAYESQLVETGVLGDAETHDFPVTTEDIGDKLAGTFADAVGPLAARFLKVADNGRVAPAVLDTFASILPSAIGKHSRERTLYERLLFAEFPKANDHDRARRKTLVLVLRIAKQLEAAPNQGDVRWLLYAGVDWDGNALQLQEPELQTHRQRWWAYQAADIGRAAYEALLKWLLDTLETYPSGLTAERLVAAAVDALDIANTGWPKTFRQLVAELPRARNPLSEDEESAEFKLTEEVLQAGVSERRAPLRSAQAAVELLAVLYRHCGEHRDFLNRELDGGHPEAIARSLATELTFLDSQLDLALPDVLAAIFKDRILQRHLWVAMRKLQHQRDYTFLVEADDGRMRLRAKDGPVLSNPRLNPALTFLRDIHLINEHGLSKRGAHLAEAI